MSKSTTPIPPGFHSLTPHLTVSGAAKYLEFLKAAFGAVVLHSMPGPGGKVMHAAVRIGDSVLMLNDDFSAEFHQPPVVTGNIPVHLHLYVEDADAIWEQAVAAGCTVTMPIGDQFWGDRYGLVRDPFGIAWAIATNLETLTGEEMMARQAKTFGAH